MALLRHLRESLAALGLSGEVTATDINRLSAAYQLAGARDLVPPYRDPHCLDRLLEVCRRRGVRLIVPTIDPDLPFYARHAEAFAAIGVRPLVSSPRTVEIGYDKVATHRWLVEQGLPTVEQSAPAEVTDEARFPLFAKPIRGSASIGARVVKSLAQLRAIEDPDRYIVQTLATGREYTVDVYVDRAGTCRCAVPRLRLETRGGEVSKGMTVRHGPVAALARRVAEALPGAWGVLNVQVFHDDATGDTRVIEINPRFGGGYPLSHAAGAVMTRWAVEEVMGLPCTANDDSWRGGVVMLRYDDAVFVSHEQAGLDAEGRVTGGGA